MRDGKTWPLNLTDSDGDPAAGEPAGASATPAVPLDAAAFEACLGRALGENYELLGVIGRGGMGVVFRARDLSLQREVAVKVLAPEMTGRPDLRKRFIREARLAANLTHPNIVAIHDFGYRDGIAFIVMACIHGESVRDLVRRTGPQPVHAVARVLREVAWALSYAHARGVVHRDIKPDNIMIDRASGRAILMDFGLAQVDSAEESITLEGKVVGTPAYMSPEQARGKEAMTARSDIYSLGMVGFHMLTGRNPFEAASPQGILAQVISQPPPDLLSLRPDAPTWMVDAIRKASARRPSERYERAEQLAENLDRGETPGAIPPSLQYLLVWFESYIELSVVAALFFFIVGVPEMPRGTGLILACLLSLPLLMALQMVSAEGLKWSDIREGIVSWRLLLLRCLNLKYGAGMHPPTIAVLALTFLGVVFIRWGGTIQSYFDIFFGESFRAKSIDPGPLAGGEPLLFQGPVWMLWYGVLALTMGFWARLLGLPRAWRLNPHELDTLATWRIPRWLDVLGSVMFRTVVARPRVVQARSEFAQLAEPAVQATLAFNRTRRALSFGERRRLSSELFLADLVIKRLWKAEDTLARLRLKAARNPAIEQKARFRRAVESRENLLAECASVLGEFRLVMEERMNPDEEREPGQQDPRVAEELRRLSAPVRAIRTSRLVLASLLVGLIPLRVSLEWIGGPWLSVCRIAMRVSLLLLILLQILRRKVYS